MRDKFVKMQLQSRSGKRIFHQPMAALVVCGYEYWFLISSQGSIFKGRLVLRRNCGRVVRW
jgi:hypothetical protein